MPFEEWSQLSIQSKRNIFEETARRKGLPFAAAAEKDWWVVKTLELVFQTEIAAYTVFKGGTSLSKAWNLIDRFSEDIDLALDRKYLGFELSDEEMTKSQVTRLRQKSNQYFSKTFVFQLQKKFIETGISDVQIQVVDIKTADEDPVKIQIIYPSVTDASAYLQQRVLIEIGSRSLIEPYVSKPVSTYVGQIFEGRNFADAEILIPTVTPERTFLEKVFLLHEEFQQPVSKIKVARKSRHFYDLERLMDTSFSNNALADRNLYWHIVTHRKSITPVRGIDYSFHHPGSINILPPAETLSSWEKDYRLMQGSMFYSDSLSFDNIMGRMSDLKSRINKLKF